MSQHALRKRCASLKRPVTRKRARKNQELDNNDTKQSNDLAIESCSEFTCKRLPSSAEPSISNATVQKLHQYSYANEAVEGAVNYSAICSRRPNERSIAADYIKEDVVKYTPLEQQFLSFKDDHPNALLFFQHGYRYRFFGNDAQIAGAELNVLVTKGHHLLTACVSVHRLASHVKCLVAKGYKVGIIKQIDSAASKAASQNKNTLFERRLTALYTQATLIGEDIPVCNDIEYDRGYGKISNCICCMYQSTKSDKNYEMGILCVDPVSCQIQFDVLNGRFAHNELQQRLMKIQPSEILIPETAISQSIMELLQSHIDERRMKTDFARLERLPDHDFNFSTALVFLPDEFAKEKQGDSDEVLKKLLDLPKIIIQCFYAIFNHMKSFKLEHFLKLCNMTKMEDENVILNLATVKNLEIFKNSYDNSSKGTLWDVINMTKTKFGRRMLKNWLMYPSTDMKILNDRLDGVQQIVVNAHSCWLQLLNDLLNQIPDLDAILSSILHLKCGTGDFYSFVCSMNNIHEKLNCINADIQHEISCSYLKDILLEIIADTEHIGSIFVNINESAARYENKSELFKDLGMFPELISVKNSINDAITDLEELRPQIAKVLQVPKVEYVTIAGQQFMVEVNRNKRHLVPDNWIVLSATKTVFRYRPAKVHELLSNLLVLMDALDAAAEKSWLQYLKKFSAKFMTYKKIIANLATLDCLQSLAQTSLKYNFTRPKLSNDNSVMEIINGRNPVVCKHLNWSSQFVNNTTLLSKNDVICQCISGPNMGGKSTYVRQVALICLLAQIGCFVPADHATLPIFDAIFTRMGAADDIFENQSTFLTEMIETNEMMIKATKNSLVICDEIGRGTSTHDGAAIAHACLCHFVEQIGCFLLFVTHHNAVTETADLNAKCRNYHMGYIIPDYRDEGNNELSLLYKLTEGPSQSSFGLNVAQMAAIPHSIISNAEKVSTNTKHKRSDIEKFINIWHEFT